MKDIQAKIGNKTITATEIKEPTEDQKEYWGSGVIFNVRIEDHALNETKVGVVAWYKLAQFIYGCVFDLGDNDDGEFGHFDQWDASHWVGKLPTLSQ